MKVIDVDAHVLEPASVWDCLATADEQYRPTILKKVFRWKCESTLCCSWLGRILGDW